jgi:thiol-disulfide isomerase/thioredoxin
MEEIQMQPMQIKTKKNWFFRSPKSSFWTGLVIGIVILAILFAVALVTHAISFKFNKAAAPKTDTKQQATGIEAEVVGQAGTFLEVNEPVCKENGKVAIYMFSTSWCPHCQWAKPIFEKAAKEYIAKGKIVAHNWELDTNDDTLTTVKETAIPANASALYEKYNPQGSIPTFIFGCKYYRVGTGNERTGDKAAEEKEFRDLIDKLLLEQ